MVNRRKLRKLRRDPRKFFYDAVRNRQSRVEATLNRHAFLAPLFRRDMKHRYAVVSAVYNTGKYLNEYFEAMVAQSIPFAERIELIMVDDGSTDDSAAIIKRWQAKFPKNIRYVYKENGGQASARNAGLPYVSADWVTFIDPDDFINARYFEHVDDFLHHHADKDVGLLCCKWVFYYEQGKRFSNTHPLTYRFADGTFATLQSTYKEFIAGSVATQLFRADIIEQHSLRFGEDIRPNFEDGHFSGRYLVETQDLYVGFIADAVYYYRKRQDGSSTLDTSWQNPNRFDSAIANGHLHLLEFARERLGRVPLSVQRLVLYDLFWYIKKIINNKESVAFLDAEQKARFTELIHETFRYIEPSTIESFGLAGSWFFHKVGMLGMLKGEQPGRQLIYVRRVLPDKGLVQVSYFHHGDVPLEEFSVDGIDRIPSHIKTRRHEFLDETFVQERIVYVRLEADHSTLSVKLGGALTRLSLGNNQYALFASRSQLEQSQRPHVETGAPMQVRMTRKMASRPYIADRFANAWMVMDRDTQADDNAEHFYRHVKNHHPSINAFFVLRRDSHDWDRLEADGFRLIEYDSNDHRFLMLHAKHVISSHPDSFVLHYMPPKWYADLLDFKFTFLQHGVIRDDISGWLNTKTIDLFVTSSPREHESVAGDGSTYKFDELNTKMVGLSRHDVLVTRDEPTEKVILIMPTWRQALVGSTGKTSTKRDTNSAFYSSRYAQCWRSVIHSDRLRQLAEEHGYKIVFFPHANMQLYIDWFDAPDWVDVRSHATEPVLQKLYRRASVMITDYSSVFFEMGLLSKPIIYYQFDFDEMYGGAHPSRLGYFDFRRDGFGPVTETEDDLLDELGAVLENDSQAAPEYAERMLATLPRRDGENRQRTVEAILELDKPHIDGPDQAPFVLAAAENASKNESWQLAASRWEQVCQSADADDRSLFEFAKALRATAAYERAEALLQRIENNPDFQLSVAQERAEICSARGDWGSARKQWQDQIDGAAAAEGPAANHAMVRLAQAHRMLGNTTQAKLLLETLLKQPSVKDAARLECAELAAVEGDWAGAAEQWRAVIAHGSTETGLWLRLAEAHIQMGDLRRALWNVESFATETGETDATRLVMSELLVELGELEMAREMVLELIAGGEHGPDEHMATLRLARVCSKLELLRDAGALLSALDLKMDSLDETDPLPSLSEFHTTSFTSVAPHSRATRAEETKPVEATSGDETALNARLER